MSVDTSTAVVLDWAALLTGDGWSSRSADLLRSLVEERDTLTAKVAALEAAKDRAVDYLHTAMRSGGVKAAVNATTWDRAHREGLQHAINAIFAEFEKAETALASPAQEPK